jgi:hypothetical protein
MSFFLDAKVRNGVRAVKIAILYLEQSLDGWTRRSHYEDWRRSVIKELEEIAARMERELSKLPSNPYHENDSEDDAEQVALYEEARNELGGYAGGAWDNVAGARKRLAILLEDKRSGEQADLVDRAYDALGMAEQLFRLAGDRKTMTGTPTL